MKEIMRSSHFKGWSICLLGALFYWYEFLLRMSPSVMVSDLMGHFQITASGFGIMTALYYWAYTPMQLFAGMLLDSFGSRRIIGLGIFSCAVGSFLFGFSSTIFGGGFARFLIGFGSSFAFVGVLKLGAEWLPKKYFAFLVGLTTSLGMLAGIMGDLILTSLLKDLSWKSMINVFTILGFILLPVIFLVVRDRSYVEDDPNRLKVSFRDTFHGLKKILKNPQMWLCGIIANILYLSLAAFAELWGIKFLQNVYFLTAEKASLACSMIFLGWLVGSPLSGSLSTLFKSRKMPLIIGGFGSTLIMFIIILNLFPLSLGILCILLFLFGVLSSTQCLCFAISKEINAHHLAATSLAFINFLVMIGGMIFQPLIGVLLDLGWEGNMLGTLRVYSSHTYKIVFLILPIIMLIGSLITFKLKESIQE